MEEYEGGNILKGGCSTERKYGVKIRQKCCQCCQLVTGLDINQLCNVLGSQGKIPVLKWRKLKTDN